MKKALLLSAFLLPMTIATTGCVIAVDGDGDHRVSSIGKSFSDREEENREKIARLSVGTSYDTILSTFGIADFNEAYQKDNGSVQVLYYRTNRKHKDDLTTKDECTPLVFKNGQLVGWGETAYRQM